MRARDVARRAGLWLLGAGALAVAVAITAAPVPVARAAQERTPATPPVSLTLNEALARALARSADVELARVAVEEKDLAVTEAQVGEAEGQARRVLRQALQDREVARNAFLSAVHGVAVQVEESYYDLLRQRETLAVRSQTLQQARRQLQLAEARFRAGMISRQELSEAKDAAQSAQEGVDQANRALSVAQATLRALVGLEPGAPFTPADSVPLELIEPDLEAGLESALANRREIREAQAAVRFAREQVQASDNPYTPPVELQRAKLALRRAELQLRQTQDKVAGEVRSQWVQLSAARQRVEATRRARELAASRLAIAQARYDAGQIAMLDLLKAQADDASARLEAVGAVWDYNLQKARWLRAIATAPLPPLPA
ncbi:MAG: TolC family protein [Limnochordaceae bacterium]|nr:TolC family protein [Limnochordaceae bacterium]